VLPASARKKSAVGERKKSEKQEKRGVRIQIRKRKNGLDGEDGSCKGSGERRSHEDKSELDCSREKEESRWEIGLKKKVMTNSVPLLREGGGRTDTPSGADCKGKKSRRGRGNKAGERGKQLSQKPQEEESSMEDRAAKGMTGTHTLFESRTGDEDKTSIKTVKTRQGRQRKADLRA